MDDKSKYTILGISLIVLTVIFVINSRQKNDGWDKVINVMEKDEYYGIVTKRFIDKQNHNNPTIILDSGKLISLYGQQWDLISIGDSLSKEKNTTIIEVFKEDTILKIDQGKYIKSLK